MSGVSARSGRRSTRRTLKEPCRADPRTDTPGAAPTHNSARANNDARAPSHKAAPHSPRGARLYRSAAPPRGATSPHRTRTRQRPASPPPSHPIRPPSQPRGRHPVPRRLRLPPIRSPIRRVHPLHPQPPKRLRLPLSHRMPHPRQPGQLSSPRLPGIQLHQIPQRPRSEVRRRHPGPDIPPAHPSPVARSNVTVAHQSRGTPEPPTTHAQPAPPQAPERTARESPAAPRP